MEPLKEGDMAIVTRSELNLGKVVRACYKLGTLSEGKYFKETYDYHEPLETWWVVQTAGTKIKTSYGPYTKLSVLPEERMAKINDLTQEELLNEIKLWYSDPEQQG